MNGLDVVQRLRAFQDGCPTPRGETLHLGIATDPNILVVAFLRMGGESRPWAIAFGHPGEEPTILTVPEGRNRDLVADMCADFAPVLLEHLRTPGYTADDPTSWEELVPFRQIWVPNATHLDMFHHLAYAYAFTKWGAGKRGRLNAFGRACGWLFREANRPGQQHVVLATEALRSSYTFPAQDIRQGHLGFLLAWLEADGSWDARLEAARSAEDLAISTTLDPDLERRQVEPVLQHWAQARADGNSVSMEAAAETLAELQLDEVRRRYDLTVRAIDVLRRDPRRVNAGVTVLMTEGLKEQWFQQTRLELRQHDPDDGFAFFPSPETDRYPAAAASRYQVHQASEDLVTSVLLHDDQEMQLEAIAHGDAFSGVITQIEDRNPGRAMAPVWTIVSGSQGVMRLREGSWVCVIGTPKRTGRILSVTDEPGGGRIFEVEITDWKTIPKSAPPGLMRSDDEQLIGTAVGFVKNSAEQISRRKSRMVWKAEVPGSWLTHARPAGPRSVIDADVAENIDAIGPIKGAE